MSYAEGIRYLVSQNWTRREERQSGSISTVVMHAEPDANPSGGSDVVIVLEVDCDSDGRPQSAALREV